jgi:hypothetical protein
MSKPKIDAKQVLEDLKAGFDDTYLMEKYNLSAKGLQSLFQKLVAGGLVDRWLLEGGRLKPGAGTSPGEREVSAKEVLKDLRSGMTQDAMMHKYRLSAQGLANLFEQLVEAGLMAESELDQGSSLENTVEITEKGFGDILAKAREEALKRQEEIPAPSSPSTRESETPEGPVIIESNTAPTWQCPACKETFTGEGDRCPKCGTSIARFLAEREVPFGDEPSIGMDQTMELVWQCPGCGVRQYKAYDVCPECGLAVADYYAAQAAGKGLENAPEQVVGASAGEALSDLRKDPDMQADWLKDGLQGGDSEFRKQPYTRLVRLARALTWIALIQLVVVILLTVTRLLTVKSYGVDAAFILPSVFITLLLSVLGYVFLRSAAELIKVIMDLAHSLTESNRLLVQILGRSKRG